MYPPDTNEIDGNIAAERYLEPLGQGVIASIPVELVRKGDLLGVIFGEESNLV
jgi:hypothetical protein